MRGLTLLTLGIALLLLGGCAGSDGELKPGKRYFGLASHYGPEWEGRLTATGETFHNKELTAAHKKLPFGTKVRVTLLSTQKSVVVRINDRGPYVRGRVIDLSDEAARRIGLDRHGVAEVLIEVLKVGKERYISPAKRKRMKEEQKAKKEPSKKKRSAGAAKKAPKELPRELTKNGLV